MVNSKLDAKDYAILKELDINVRQSFSKIGKKVGLSKNSVALRFEKLKDHIAHATTGIDYEILGYAMVKVFYTLDFYDEKTEQDIIREVRKHENILWASRLYGDYDLCICLLANNFDDIIFQIAKFDDKFSSKISRKEIQIIFKQIHFRNNFVHKEPAYQSYQISKTEKRISLSKADRKVLLAVRHSPRENLVKIAMKTRLSEKTVANRLKFLERSGVITGYFITLDAARFGFDSFKLLIQIKNPKEVDEFEKYFSSIGNVHYVTKMLGSWDYEIDCMYHNITELQSQIEVMKQKFPSTLKRICILSFGKRIITNKEDFLN